jgi:hypothetical protein
VADVTTRRGFLGLLAGAAAAVALLPPIEHLFAEVAPSAPATFSELSAMLREIYPPAFFEELIEREAPFRTFLRNARDLPP